MRTKKYIIALLLIVCLFVGSACSKGETGPKKLWDKFVEAVNTDNAENIAGCYSAKGSTKYTEYLNSSQVANLIEYIDKVETVSFELETQSDLSTDKVAQKYFSAKVKANITRSGTLYEEEFEIYMSLTTVNGWFFTSHINLNSNDGTVGNQPDDLWLSKALKSDGDFMYKSTFAITENGIEYYNVAISHYNKNEKDVVIPSEIDGLPVTVIKKYAFMKLGSIFEITFSNSKMRTLTLPETLITIEDYAFFESVKLKELSIPNSVTSIGEFAFASSTGLKKISFNIDDSGLYTEEKLKEVQSESKYDVSIKGARNLYVGDIIKLSEGNNKLVTWSASPANVATIDPDKGTLTALSSGSVTITASIKNEPSKSASVTLQVEPCTELIKVQGSSIDRCSGLEELYVYARNPYSFGIAGTAFKLSSKVKIYVPKGSKEMYASSANWSAYKDQIFEME